MNFKDQNICIWHVDFPMYEQEMKDKTQNLFSNLLQFWTAPLQVKTQKKKKNLLGACVALSKIPSGMC